MLFSSVSFLYFFLPVFLAVYFAVPNRFRNGILLFASLLFYFIGEPVYILILLFSSGVDYVNGRIIEGRRGTAAAKAALIGSLLINVGLLGFFKYSDFFVENVNALFGTGISPLGLALPLGISFYTFQTMSYTIDVYRGDVRARENFLDFAAYVTMFPQLVAGPIVRYETVAEELSGRRASFSGFSYGVRRFVLGLSKKVLLANTLGQLAVAANTGSASGEASVLLYWLSAVGFTFQIYFDFSGYSDMAIGLGRMMGFHFPENFKYPYTARSVTEFWRRWHITLSGWFRDYVYIPLGGNRVSKLRWVFNICVVWFLTGFWHGAGWNFILWGLFFAVFLCLEKFVFRFFLGKWSVTDRIYTILVIIFSFVIFDTTDFSLLPQRLSGMLGVGSSVTGNPAATLPLFNDYSIYYLKSYAGLLLIGAVASTPLAAKLCGRFEKQLSWAEPIVLAVLLLVSTAYIVDSSFNPFLYFRF